MQIIKYKSSKNQVEDVDDTKSEFSSTKTVDTHVTGDDYNQIKTELEQKKKQLVDVEKAFKDLQTEVKKLREMVYKIVASGTYDNDVRPISSQINHFSSLSEIQRPRSMQIFFLKK